jgi:serine protease Do
MNLTQYFKAFVHPREGVAVGLAMATLLSSSMLVSADSKIDDLQQLEARLIRTAERVRPAVVGIGGGSGVVVSKDGLVLTAGHVVPKAGRALTVRFLDGRTAKAKSLGADLGRDCGMVKIEEPGEWPHVDISDAESRIGQWVFGLGHPSGFQIKRGSPLRLGQVLRLGSYIVSDCTITAGDSGGPLFDMDGNVIGIHSSISNSITSNNHVPIKPFRDGWDRMLASETWGARRGASRAVMGIMVDRQDESKGVRIGRVMPDSPSKTAGLEDGDLIVRFDGKNTDTYEAFYKALSGKDPGDEVEVVVRRDGKEITAKLELAKRR